MTEPVEIAEELVQVAEGVYHWRIHNSAIGGGISSSHAVVGPNGCVFIDPVQLADAALVSLPRPHTVLLTARCHQRSAWRLRRQFSARVWLPDDAEPADEEPDDRYAEGQPLPGDLIAIRTPGPEWAHYCLLLQSGPEVLFCSDLVIHDGGGRLHFVPPQYHEDPAETRLSVERLLELPFTIMCFAHGEPLTEDPKGALRRLLQSTA